MLIKHLFLTPILDTETSLCSSLIFFFFPKDKHHVFSLPNSGIPLNPIALRRGCQRFLYCIRGSLSKYRVEEAEVQPQSLWLKTLRFCSAPTGWTLLLNYVQTHHMEMGDRGHGGVTEEGKARNHFALPGPTSTRAVLSTCRRAGRHYYQLCARKLTAEGSNSCVV